MTFPEGGLQAWLTVAGASMVLFCTFGMVQSFGVFQDYYTRVSLTDRTTSEISWIGSVQVFLLFGVALPVGKLYDEGYFHHLMAFGSLLYLFSIFMLSLCKPHHYYQNFLSQGVGMGLAMAILFLPAVSIVSHYFQRRRAASMGVVFAGSSLGGVIWPIMLNRLFNNSAGFAWGVRTAGFIALVLLLIANLIMRTRLPSAKQRPPMEKPRMATILSDRAYWVTITGGLFIFWGLFFPFFYLQLFAVLHGVDRNIALYSIPLLNAGSVFGRTIPNYLADKWGKFNVILPCTTISAALVFALFGATNTGGMVVFALLYGFFSGVFISLVSPLLAGFSMSVQEVGLRIGVGMTWASVALLVGNPISGALLAQPRFLWYRPIIFNAVMIFAGCALQFTGRQMLRRKRRMTSQIL
ncbi:MFS general substrate transporter [Cristinia sonorae]|uniref:MFS general substrate transporter n=1 Tax=Cristinia sonorae TaxID=1940300 RepID=A0A8K0UII7_9AGAR|nr:MFS general substrate transporter [Cristinia sonorae]